MIEDWRQPGSLGGSDMERPGPFQEGPDILNSRDRETVGPGLDSRVTDMATRDDIHYQDMRFSEFETIGPNMRGGRGRRPRPWDQEIRNERGGSESRHSHIPASPDFSGPQGCHQDTRFQGPSDPHFVLSGSPRGPSSNRGKNPFPETGNPNHQRGVKPQRHRTALLPTPTEGLISLPNHTNNNPEIFGPKRRPRGQATDRGWGRGRPMSQERQVVKGQSQEREKGALTGRGDEQKDDGSKTNK